MREGESEAGRDRKRGESKEGARGERREKRQEKRREDSPLKASWEGAQMVINHEA